MKTILIAVLAAFILTTAFQQQRQDSGIVGTIEPADAARKVWAIAGTDSVGVIPMGGKFSIPVKPGNWSLYVEAVAPFQPGRVDAILVTEGHPTNAGVIRLTSK